MKKYASILAVLLLLGALVPLAGCENETDPIAEADPESGGAQVLSEEEMNYQPMKGNERVSGQEEPSPENLDF